MAGLGNPGEEKRESDSQTGSDKGTPTQSPINILYCMRWGVGIFENLHVGDARPWSDGPPQSH